MNDGNKLALIGAGGHAHSVTSAITERGLCIDVVAAPQNAQALSRRLNCKYLVCDKELLNLNSNIYHLVNGIGMLPYSLDRRRVYELFKNEGFKFLSAISIHATISSNVSMGEGVQVLAAAVINTDSVIGNNTILNTGSIIEHHVTIGDHCHVAPGAIICGSARLGENVFVGAGAIVVQGSIVPNNIVIKAGEVYKS